MIPSPGTAIGIRHHDDFWIPATVVGVHATGALIVRTLPDPGYVEDVEARGYSAESVTVAVPRDHADGQTDFWRQANACQFRRRCATCKGVGSTAGRYLGLTADGPAYEPEPCTDCTATGWVPYEPFGNETGDVSARAATAAHGDTSL